MHLLGAHLSINSMAPRLLTETCEDLLDFFVFNILDRRRLQDGAARQQTGGLDTIGMHVLPARLAIPCNHSGTQTNSSTDSSMHAKAYVPRVPRPFVYSPELLEGQGAVLAPVCVEVRQQNLLNCSRT